MHQRTKSSCSACPSPGPGPGPVGACMCTCTYSSYILYMCRQFGTCTAASVQDFPCICTVCMCRQFGTCTAADPTGSQFESGGRSPRCAAFTDYSSLRRSVGQSVSLSVCQSVSLSVALHYVYACMHAYCACRLCKYCTWLKVRPRWVRSSQVKSLPDTRSKRSLRSGPLGTSPAGEHWHATWAIMA